MNQNVDVFVTGIHQREGEPTEKVETVATGTYQELEDGSRIVEYDEEQDTGTGSVKVHNRVRIESGDKTMEIVREGATRSTLHFGESMEYDTEYITPYGSMQMKIRTKSFDLNTHGEEEIRVMTEYELEIGEQVISSSMIVMEIKNAVAK